MELPLELLLTFALSVIMAFFFRKIVPVSSSDGKNPDAQPHASAFQRSAAHDAEGEAVRSDELLEGLHEVWEMAEVCGNECTRTRFDESIHLEEQDAEETVRGFEANNSATAEKEEHSPDETSEDGIGGAARGLTVQEDAVAEDADRKVDSSLSRDEEEASQAPDSRELDKESITEAGKSGSMIEEDDDWEGIEKSDLEELFAAAAEFVGSAAGSETISQLSDDMQMQLFGLHKIAKEGPCNEAQPMALKVSARAKWHAWQKQGRMNPEEAMEKYVALLSETVPSWTTTRSHGVAMEGLR